MQEDVKEDARYTKVADDVEFIMQAMSAAVVDVALMTKSDRTNVRRWLNGKRAALKKSMRLSEIREAATVFHESGIAPQRRMFIRPILGGRGYFEIVGDGQDPVYLINALIDILKKEAGQRARLSKRIGSHRRKNVDWGECGSPHLDEESRDE